MPRLPGVPPAGIPIHIIQRDNNRQVCFVAEDDHLAYTDWLIEYAVKHRVDNHVMLGCLVTLGKPGRPKKGILPL